MCGGAIIYDYIPARRQASAADFWPDANDDYAAHDAGPDKGKYAQHISFAKAYRSCFLVCEHELIRVLRMQRAA
jgi:hypothetical protein